MVNQVLERNFNFQKDKFMDNNTMTKEDLIKAGSHYGHPASKWNPNYKDFIVAKKNGIHIIDVESTINYLNVAVKEMINDKVVIIDVGINRVNDNSKKGYFIVGDVDFNNVRNKVKAITPVPGGVGVMTVTMLLYNTVFAAKKAGFHF